MPICTLAFCVGGTTDTFIRAKKQIQQTITHQLAVSNSGILCVRCPCPMLHIYICIYTIYRIQIPYIYIYYILYIYKGFLKYLFQHIATIQVRLQRLPGCKFLDSPKQVWGKKLVSPGIIRPLRPWCKPGCKLLDPTVQKSNFWEKTFAAIAAIAEAAVIAAAASSSLPADQIPAELLLGFHLPLAKLQLQPRPPIPQHRSLHVQKPIHCPSPFPQTRSLHVWKPIHCQSPLPSPCLAVPYTFPICETLLLLHIHKNLMSPTRWIGQYWKPKNSCENNLARPLAEAAIVEA